MAKAKDPKDPSVEVGDKITVAGLEIDVVNQETLNDAADKGEMAYVCMPTKLGPSAIPDSRKLKCQDCKQGIWISPATYAAWQSSDGEIICIECMKKHVEAAPGSDQKQWMRGLGHTTDQLKETNQLKEHEDSAE